MYLAFFLTLSFEALPHRAVARRSKAMPGATLTSHWKWTPGTRRVQKVKARQATGKAAGVAPGGDKMEPPLEEPGREAPDKAADAAADTAAGTAADKAGSRGPLDQLLETQSTQNAQERGSVLSAFSSVLKVPCQNSLVLRVESCRRSGS